MLVSEVNILREFRHPHIVRYYDRIVDRDNTMIYIVMEHCEGGDLSTLIKTCRRERRHLEEEFIWKIVWQLLKAMEVCKLIMLNCFLKKHRTGDGSFFVYDPIPEGEREKESARRRKEG